MRMTPVLQTAVTGLVWALSVSVVILALGFFFRMVMPIDMRMEEKGGDADDQGDDSDGSDKGRG